MNIEALRAYLDGLIAEVRGGFTPVDAAMHEIAGAVHRYGIAEKELIAIGETLRSMRQPVPLQAHPEQPLPRQVPTDARAAEEAEAAWFEQQRQQVLGGGNG